MRLIEALDKLGAIAPNSSQIKGTPISLPWRGIVYSSETRQGYASLSWYRDMTPWHWGWDRDVFGNWCFSAHCPIAQLVVIGPFCRQVGGAA